MTSSRLLLNLLFLLIDFSLSQLVVNVRNNGGEVVKETILANTTADTVTLEFQRPDGSVVTQLIDFASEVQIFRLITMAEEEKGQKPDTYQVLCHVIRFSKSDFISADAMSKLRQKNPGAIRQPEDDKGLETFLMESLVLLSESSSISPHISVLCAEATQSTYVREQDLRLIAKILNKDYHVLAAATQPIPSLPRLQEATNPFVETEPKCRDVSDWNQPCFCLWENCIGWYPCGLKYCRGKDGSGKMVSYRCGIKTCQKCRYFTYQVKRKELCLWDEQ